MSSLRSVRPITATLLLGVALLGGLAACGAAEPVSHEEAPAIMDADVFVQLIVELRRAAREATDFDDFGVRRDSILARYGYEEADLEEFAETRGGDIEPMIAIWEAINQALREEKEGEVDKRGAPR